VNPIGKYRWIWAGCAVGYGDVLWTESPYYGRRQGPFGPQILIPVIGQLQWVNIDDRDIIS